MLPVALVVFKYPKQGQQLKQEHFKTEAREAAVKAGAELLEVGTTGPT